MLCASNSHTLGCSLCGLCSQVVDNACLSLYCGFDPTADSLHLGERGRRQGPGSGRA